ncbi:MAG: hypothetical protein Q7S82_02600 [bacterium]|nr:hypothetical protein [bacterium]
MSFLEKLQNLPVVKKKIILWTIVVVVAIFLLIIWAGNFQKKIKNFQPVDFQKPNPAPESQ